MQHVSLWNVQLNVEEALSSIAKLRFFQAAARSPA